MIMLVMIVVAMMHEQVHQRAGEQQQKWQRAKQVCAVLRE